MGCSPWGRKESDTTERHHFTSLHFTSLCKRQKKGDTDTEDKSHNEEGRDEREGATGPGTPGAPEARKGRKDLILEPLEGCTTLISDIWSARLWEDEFLLF